MRKGRFALLMLVGVLIAMALVGTAVAKQTVTISGTVTITDSEGNISPAVWWNMWVTVPGPDGYQVAHTITDLNGHYSMCVPAGKGYTVIQEWRTDYCTADPQQYFDVKAHHDIVLDFDNDEL